MRRAIVAVNHQEESTVTEARCRGQSDGRSAGHATTLPRNNGGLVLRRANRGLRIAPTTAPGKAPGKAPGFRHGAIGV